MSIESLAIALHHSRARGATKLVLLGIANHDGDGGAWPAVSTLAKYANVDKRSVQRSLDQLERLGEVRRIIGQGGDHSAADNRRPNLYRFLLACPHDCDRTSQHRTARVAAIMLDERLLTGVTPAPPHDVGVTHRGDVGVTQTISNNHLSLVKKPTTGRAQGCEGIKSGLHKYREGACIFCGQPAEAVHA
jgi:hypothetical protein